MPDPVRELKARASILHSRITSGDRDAIERLFETMLEGDEAAWRLRLVPRAPDARRLIRVIEVEGREAEVLSLTLERPNGDRTVTTLQPHAP
jgi:hypothetical protein